jgi:hypothetical protein
VVLRVMIIVIMLIYNVSLTLRLPLCMNIHNQCSNTKLVLPVYFGNGTVHLKLSGRQIDTSTKMNASLGINATQNNFKGVLLFKLQIYSDSQHNVNTSTKKANKEKEKYVYMLVVCKMKNSNPFAYAALIEYTEEYIWSENELKKLYDQNHDQFKKYNGATSGTWLMSNNMILKTSLNVIYSKRKFELGISISEEKKRDYAMRPFRINLKR